MSHTDHHHHCYRTKYHLNAQRIFLLLFAQFLRKKKANKTRQTSGREAARWSVEKELNEWLTVFDHSYMIAVISGVADGVVALFITWSIISFATYTNRTQFDHFRTHFAACSWYELDTDALINIHRWNGHNFVIKKKQRQRQYINMELISGMCLW